MTDLDLPFSTETEQYLLSTCIVNEKAIDLALDLVSADDFYWPDNRKLFAKMVELHGRNTVVDVATLSAEGMDADYLHLLLDCPAISARTRDYAEQVAALSVRRRVIMAGMRIVDVAQSNPDANEVLDEAEAAIMGARGRETEDAPCLICETLDKFDFEVTSPHFGLRTHIDEINDIIIGMQEGSFNILAARPGEGKTCMACDIARNLSRDVHVLFFSVEMTKREVAERMIAAEGTVGLTKLRTGTMDERETKVACEAVAALRERNLTIDDSTTTMYDVQRKVRRVAARGDLSLVVVDYIQLLKMSRRNYESKQQEVAEISRAMKLMAREYDIPVIGVSQLNRPERKYDTEKSKPQRPTLASLRDSGALEQDADQVWFLFHPEDNCHETEFIVAKNRSGPTGTAIVHFWPQFTTFYGVGEQLAGYHTKPVDSDSHIEGKHPDDCEPEEMF